MCYWDTPTHILGLNRKINIGDAIEWKIKYVLIFLPRITVDAVRSVALKYLSKKTACVTLRITRVRALGALGYVQLYNKVHLYKNRVTNHMRRQRIPLTLIFFYIIIETCSVSLLQIPISIFIAICTHTLLRVKLVV